MPTSALTVNDTLTIDEAARELNKSRRQVERLLTEGRLPRLGAEFDRRRVFIPKSAVESIKRVTPLDPERRRSRAEAAAAD